MSEESIGVMGGLAAIIVWVIIGYCFYKYFKTRKEISLKKETLAKSIICPNMNCGFQGQAIRIKRANMAIGILLLFFGFLPGLLYFIFKSGYRYSCPKCGLQIRTDN